MLFLVIVSGVGAQNDMAMGITLGRFVRLASTCTRRGYLVGPMCLIGPCFALGVLCNASKPKGLYIVMFLLYFVDYEAYVST